MREWDLTDVELPEIKAVNYMPGDEVSYYDNFSEPKPPDFLGQLVKEAQIVPGTDPETAKAQMANHIVLKSRQHGTSAMHQEYMRILEKAGLNEDNSDYVKLGKPKFNIDPELVKFAKKAAVFGGEQPTTEPTMKFEDGKWVDK
jgi:hypothetical protein